MRRFIAFSILFLLSATRATAASTTLQVEPNQAVQTGLQFNVSRIDRAARSQFTVDITAKNTALPEAQIWISVIEVEPASFSSRGVRPVGCATEAARIHCEFTVSAQELQNPNLSFAFSIPVRVEQNGEFVLMPSIDLLYFRLNDPQIPVVSAIDW